MRLEQVGDGPRVREVYDTDDCAGCGGKLAYPHVLVGWLQCGCAKTAGHRTRTCRDCGTITYEPWHDATAAVVVGGGGYFNG